MDPISILLLALKAGAKLAAESTIGDAASDAYNAFKERIKKRFSGKKAAEVALEEYEKDPDVWKQPLIKALKELNADKDRAILRLAEDILEKAGDTYQVNITGPTAIGPRAKAANTFIEYHFFPGDDFFEMLRLRGLPDGAAWSWPRPVCLGTGQI